MWGPLKETSAHFYVHTRIILNGQLMIPGFFNTQYEGLLVDKLNHRALHEFNIL